MPTLNPADWTNIEHIAEFLGAILASLVTAFVQARKTSQNKAQAAKDEDEDLAKETVSGFSMLVKDYKKRIEELKSELSEVDASHKKERAVLVRAIFNATDHQGVLSATDLYDLRQFGVEVREQHRETQEHIERAKTIADDTAQALEAESDNDPDDTDLS